MRGSVIVRNVFLFATLVSLGTPVYAQRSSSRRATISGGGSGDSGKCTIEVRVDQSADVEINGDMGRIHTLSGQPATWNRFECTSPIPRNVSDFRFRGIDGRGRVNLVRDPRSNGGTAIVHIEDSQGGSEGYTFDLEWQGGSYNDGRYNDGRYNNGRYNDGRYNDGRYNDDRYNNGRYDDRRYNDGQNDRYTRDNRTNIVTCSSDDMRRHYCDADTRDGVRMVRQRGDAACRQGSTWGYDRRGIWVDRGCRADFAVGR
jgi:DUF3011 family protein